MLKSGRYRSPSDFTAIMSSVLQVQGQMPTGLLLVRWTTKFEYGTYKALASGCASTAEKMRAMSRVQSTP